ncbi:hypothetical protein cand_005670 [Cryptosporidium andersoni]|uniref:CST complex subunit CTC1 n=1 Tax=Cryptosporidium andersoni TaxID=117008 RepID=A0A1J4MPI8_9CRYT|nr:hypothetical protein cand_005670 [Cryptosporidium andersoni]
MGDNLSGLICKCDHSILESYQFPDNINIYFLNSNEIQNKLISPNYFLFKSGKRISKDWIIGRILFCEDGRIWFIQSNEDLAIKYNNSQSSIINCEISGFFTSSLFLQCKVTRVFNLSCLIAIRDWKIMEISAKETISPKRKLLSSMYFSCINFPLKSTHNDINVIRDRILCLNANTIIWLSDKKLSFKSSLDNYSLIGIIIHISPIIRSVNKQKTSIKTIDQCLVYQTKNQDNKYNIFDFNIKPSRWSNTMASYSIKLYNIETKSIISIYFPGNNLLVYRYIFDWHYIISLSNLYFGKIVVFEEDKESLVQCYIAHSDTLVYRQELIPDHIRSLQIFPILLQIKKNIGFGVYEISSLRNSVRLYLHNACRYETSINFSITKGSILWVRNFRCLFIKNRKSLILESCKNFSSRLLVGIAVEYFSDWGLYKHSNLIEFEYESYSLSNTLNMQLLSHEYLEYSDSSVDILQKLHPWDIRNFCYFHYNLYVDIFNIFLSNHDEFDILPVSILDAIKNKLDFSDIMYCHYHNRNNTNFRKYKNSNICKNDQITHPGQLLLLQDKDHYSNNVIYTDCNDRMLSTWRLATIEEWYIVIDCLARSDIDLSVLNALNNEVISIEYFEYLLDNDKIILPHDRYNSYTNQFTDTFSIVCNEMEDHYLSVILLSVGSLIGELFLDFEEDNILSNLHYICTPQNGFNKEIFPVLFLLHGQFLANIWRGKTIEEVYKPRIIYIEKLMIIFQQKKMFLIVEPSNMIFISPKNDISSHSISATLLFIKSKKTIREQNNTKYIFYCVPLFRSILNLSYFTDQDTFELIELSIVLLEIPIHWYLCIESQSFILLTTSDYHLNNTILLDPEFEDKLLSHFTISNTHRSNGTGYYITQLTFPYSDFSSNSSNYIEVKNGYDSINSLLWSTDNKFTLKLDLLSESWPEKFTKLTHITAFDIKNWVNNIVDWYLFKKSIPIIYNHTNIARFEIISICNNLNNICDIIPLISLEKVKILDIIHFKGYNPLNIYGNWIVLRVTTGSESLKYKDDKYLELYPIWNSGWNDIWISKDIAKNSLINAIFPGQIVSINRIYVTITKQSTPHTLVSGILQNVILETIYPTMENHIITSDQDFSVDHLTPNLSSYTSQILSYKSSLNSLNYGNIIFLSSIRNNKLQLMNSNKYDKKSNTHNFLYFDQYKFSSTYMYIDTYSEIFIHKLYENKENSALEYESSFLKYYNYPNPYILGPDGSPIASKIIFSNNHSYYLSVINRSYCFQSNIYINEYKDHLYNFWEILSDKESENYTLDPDGIFCFSGTILHIEYIEIRWFCLNCLQVLQDGPENCLCKNHNSDLSSTSMIVTIIGSIEIDHPNNSQTKIFPFVITNWNAIKLLAYIHSYVKCQPEITLGLAIPIAKVLWNKLYNQKGFSNSYTIYNYKELKNLSSKNFIKPKKHIGILGYVELFEDEDLIIIPLDPLETFKLEACIRFIQSSEDKSIFAYIHIVRWVSINYEYQIFKYNK